MEDSLFDVFGCPQEAQERLLELDRLCHQLDAVIEKSKNATVEEHEVKMSYFPVE